MNITVFKKVTTEDVIKAFEEDALTYQDLYVDMDNKDERKFVKENSALITGLRKALNRARIDLTKEGKQSIDSEFKAIDDRLAKANEPFTLLEDAHKEKRAKELSAEKAAVQAIIDADQKEVDHEFALMINKTYEFDQAELARIQKEFNDEIAKSAAAHALDVKAREDEQAKQDKINADNARLANTEYVASVRKGILDALMEHKIPEETARLVIRLAVHNKLPKLTINY